MGVFGDTLRQARAYKGVTIKEAEQATRINRHHLAALEEENFSALPPLIYQRGIVRNYASYLDLDAGKLLAMFEEAHGFESSTDVVPAVKPLNMPNHFAPNFAIIAFMVVMSAIVFAWAYSAYFAAEQANPTVAALIPTVTPIPRDRVVLPTMTPVPSSPTTLALAPTTGAAASVVKATATAIARPTATAVVITAPIVTDPPATDPPVIEEQPTDAPVVEEQPVEEAAVPTTVQGDVISLSFAAGDTDITITVTADGVALYNGYLAAGQSTQAFTGQAFEVYSSSIENTWITNFTSGAPAFLMPGGGEGTLYLP
jgi:cytoskeleton protein RodZ